MKKLISLVIILFLYHCSGFAQITAGVANVSPSTVITHDNTDPKGNGKITGTVIDNENNRPVEFATITLTDPGTKKPVDGTICDEKGKFTINKVAPGNYIIAVSFIGYETKTLNNVSISDNKNSIDLGTIKISEGTKVLNEVTVQGQKDLMEERVDRTIYNAENDLTNKGGDATDVLRKVPMLSVDMDGNVTLRGSQSILVLINNKPSTIMASSVADALKQIPSDMIKSVEVITSPSAKYDAEGASGIINIITKKNTLQGFTLGIDGSVGIRGSNMGLNGSFRKGKLGISLGGFGRTNYNVKGAFENTQIINREGLETTNLQSADTRMNGMFGRYQLGLDYDINDKNYITGSVSFGLRQMNNRQNDLHTQSFLGGDLLREEFRDVKTNDLGNNVDVNLNYTHLFKKPQQEFSILSQFSRNNRINSFSNYLYDNEDFSLVNRRKNENESFNEEITVQLDYQNPIGKNQMIEFGGKEIFRRVISDYRTFNADAQGEYVKDENVALANIFNYNQNVTAGYLSYTLNFLKTFSVKAGGRYEYTIIDANFENQSDEDIEIPSYGVLVPSINLSKKLKKGNTVKAAYNRRIQRPSLQFLNPNIQNPNQLFVTIGNPELRPEYTNNFELSYNTYIKKSSLSFSAFMRNTNNSIQSLRQPNGDTIVTTYRNIGNENAYGISIFSGINISNKFSLNGGTDVYYAVLDNNEPNPLYNASNEGWVASYRLFGNYNITDKWGLQAFGFYRGRQVQLQGSQGGFGIYSLSLRRELKDKKGSIGFGAENFFTTSFKIKNEVVSPTINQSSTMSLYNMNFKVNFSYRIGKMSADPRQRRRKTINNDDMKDGGGDNSQGVQQQSAPASSGQAPAQMPRQQQGQGQKPATAPVQKTEAGNGSSTESKEQAPKAP